MLQNGSIPIPASKLFNSSLCFDALHSTIGETGVHFWDVFLLVSPTLFLVYVLAFKLRPGWRKLRAAPTSTKVISLLSGLVLAVAALSVVRAVVAMLWPGQSVLNEIMWLVLRCVTLMLELIVILFALSGVKKNFPLTVALTVSLSLAFAALQAGLEFTSHLRVRGGAEVPGERFGMFAHGGFLFWLCSSIALFSVYAGLLLLPYVCRRALPTRRRFYIYAGLLGALNLLQAVGAGLVWGHNQFGFCLVDTTTFLFFSFFAPCVYVTFLRAFYEQPQAAPQQEHQQQQLLYHDDDHAVQGGDATVSAMAFKHEGYAPLGGGTGGGLYDNDFSDSDSERNGFYIGGGGGGGGGGVGIGGTGLYGGIGQGRAFAVNVDGSGAGGPPYQPDYYSSPGSVGQY